MNLTITKIDVRRIVQSRQRFTTRVYVSVDEGKRKTVSNMLTDRWTNPVKDYKKQVIPTLLKKLGWEGVKVRWSQYAGCSCPCSPGFIINQVGPPKDIWVTVVPSQPELL